MMSAKRWSALAALGFVALAAAGCPAENKRVLTQGPYKEPSRLVGNETEADVEQQWGKPNRVIEAKDEKTGRTTTIWVYERYVDTNGSHLTTFVTFDEGRVREVEKQEVPRTDINSGYKKDSEERRDMWWR
jgi:hypothetical protein